MEIKVNNDTIQISNDSNILSLMQHLRGEKLNGLAVALNDTVVPRSQWDKIKIKANDDVLIIQATQGG
ncbi:MAG: sulfur carrier protein ThiS [Flavobacteriales bacterium]